MRTSRSYRSRKNGGWRSIIGYRASDFESRISELQSLIESLEAARIEEDRLFAEEYRAKVARNAKLREELRIARETERSLIEGQVVQ
ncbi:hypothetical protein J19TS2_24670 [Cohnella xylanilytica]|uniref:Uncharacterized protein n=1 Tax=Cohnella xylanilytica TaxID=557555 RepID=A0A841TZH3_9BACL|nr:hypothetical protein [Cohnella xylanilytica]MBB6691523.1 hypothetical protein [Cohnella xylanilytica]GIO12912.1 hypothetical protein J19TS2_24670 [Cohnella xylanilytica]